MGVKKNILTEKYKSNSPNSSNDDVFISKIKKVDVNSAGFKYDELQNQINTFQKNLSSKEDISISFAAYENKPIEINFISYHEPDFIYFYGTYNGNKIQIIQNIYQLNFMLIAYPKVKSSKEPNRIGFKPNSEDKK